VVGKIPSCFFSGFMTKTSKQEKGMWGEEKAASFLKQKGYKIVERNFKIHKVGEVDIIAFTDKHYFGRTLCFVEVKTRGRDDGSAQRSVGKSKLQKMFAAGKIYCFDNNIDIDRTPIQFEQVSVYGSEERPIIRHYELPVD